MNADGWSVPEMGVASQEAKAGTWCRLDQVTLDNTTGNRRRADLLLLNTSAMGLNRPADVGK